MRRTIDFRYSMFDTVTVAPGEMVSDVAFFSDTHANQASVDEFNEQKALAWMVDQPDVAGLLCESFDVPAGSLVCANVVRPFYREPHHGDIDVFLSHRESPSLAVACQVKRFKVHVQNGAEVVSLDGQKLDTLIEQCSRTLEMGFSRVFGVILTMFDARTSPEVCIPRRQMSNSTFTRIYDFAMSRSFPKDVGVAFFELTQPTGKVFPERCMVAVAVDQTATSNRQPPALTAKVERLLEGRAKAAGSSEGRK